MSVLSMLLHSTQTANTLYAPYVLMNYIVYDSSGDDSDDNL